MLLKNMLQEEERHVVTLCRAVRKDTGLMHSDAATGAQDERKCEIPMICSELANGIKSCSAALVVVFSAKYQDDR